MNKITLSYLLQSGFKYVLVDNLELEDRIKYSSLSSKHKNIWNFYLKKSYWEYDFELDGEIKIEVLTYKTYNAWVFYYNNKTYKLKHINQIEFTQETNYNLNFIYILKSEMGYKIGRTNNIDNRLSIFNVKLPFNWVLLKIYSVKNSKEIEKFLHNNLQENKINGEWFNLNCNQLKNIENFIYSVNK